MSTRRKAAFEGEPVEEKRSPAMQQFFRAKEQVPDALIFFRMGDFYELFHEDAVIAARALDITLTGRGKNADGSLIPMAGVPHHAASAYLARLIEQGFRVAICEQMADPSTVKGVVPREIVRIVTPGLSLDPETLESRVDNWLVVGLVQKGAIAVAAFDLGRGEARVGSVRDEVEWLAELARLEPREVLFEGFTAATESAMRTLFPRARFGTPPKPSEATAKHVANVDVASRDALHAALTYAQLSLPMSPLRVDAIVPLSAHASLELDEPALRNLEILKSLSGERQGSLLHAVDLTVSSMGARALRRRLVRPLADLARIRERHEAVAFFVQEALLRADVRKTLRDLRDLERLLARIETGLGSPKDVGDVRNALAVAATLGELLHQAPGEVLVVAELASALTQKLIASLEPDLPTVANQGGLIRLGVDAAIDALRTRASSLRDGLLALETRERDANGIASLKIGYTRVFGHYIEVTRANLRSVPSHFKRKQTIANGERYTTDELDEIERDLQRTEDELHQREAELFETLRSEVSAASPQLRRVAQWLARVDVSAAFAELAVRDAYVQPTLDESRSLHLLKSRHPVVEQSIPSGDFVPNDVLLEGAAMRLTLLTGPNMAGKSTAMRQVAISVILAQAGSFVPCAQATIGLVDRIFTRVGASDNLARGQSTFMVEMAETASLLRGATARSLVLLDEVGRGTSTYDGLAIARAVAEHLVDEVKCRALFATHYHELCELAATRPEFIRNVNVAAREHEGRIVFLHQLLPGAASRSYGVDVAKLAGLPEPVIARAREMLRTLEEGPRASDAPPPQTTSNAPSLKPSERAVLDALKHFDANATTPLEALRQLADWSSRLRAD